MDLFLSVTVLEVTAANYQIICLKRMMMFQLYLIRWGSSFQMHQSLLNRNCSNKVPPNQSASLSHSLRPTVSIENITISNKMAIAKQKKMMNAPFKNNLLVHMYHAVNIILWLSNQIKKFSGPVVYMRWPSSLVSHIEFLLRWVDAQPAYQGLSYLNWNLGKRAAHLPT